ncbi:hypothetical protein [Niallia taxi]|uniref:Uncharacterized protein n=1 Tax=Niallia taxi TaxID=2499688 RepID=A0A437K5Q1_9BACI|nr:hypothetical protein [Niallia taxi]RVT58272.1 hypothetical protein EM808_22410 [Niallia taxi]
MYPYVNYSYPQVSYDYNYQQGYYDDPNRQMQLSQLFNMPQWKQWERRINQLERENNQQQRDIDQLERSLQRVNQRLNALEKR